MIPFRPVHELLSYDFIFCRLWGDHGQTSLEQARVCLINATATGTEILKNLILPGEMSASYQTRDLFFVIY